MTGSQTTGQVLGASTSVAAGVALLPTTSSSFVLSTLTILAIVSGVSVLLAFIVTRLIKK